MPSPLRFRRSRYTPPRPWEPLSDAEWSALAPFLPRDPAGRGRPMDARARCDAVFRIVSQKLPWGQAAHAGVSADAVSRQFRRWAKAGLFARLLATVAKGRRAKRVPEALRRLEHWICAAHRRTVRVCGVRAIALARRLGLLSALRGPPWLLPDPVLSGLVRREILVRLEELGKRRPTQWEWRRCHHLLTMAGGRSRIPRCLVPA